MAPERAFLSRSERATRALARDLGRTLESGDVVALEGDLGSGKTTFVRGLAEGLDVEEPVQSPTYTLMLSYEGRVALHHLDAYMEGRERAFLLDGGAEWLGEGGVSVVEWSERVADLLPEPRVVVRLKHRGPVERRLLLGVLGTGARADALRRALEGLEGGTDLIEEAP